MRLTHRLHVKEGHILYWAVSLTRFYSTDPGGINSLNYKSCNPALNYLHSNILHFEESPTMAKPPWQSDRLSLAVILNPILGAQIPNAKVDRATEHTGPFEKRMIKSPIH